MAKEETTQHSVPSRAQNSGPYSSTERCAGSFSEQEHQALHLEATLERVVLALEEVEQHDASSNNRCDSALHRIPGQSDPGDRQRLDESAFDDALRRIAELEQTNRQLQEQIAERRRVEDEIVTRSRDLERRLEKRTAQYQDLVRAQDALSRFLGDLCSNPLRSLDNQARQVAERWGHSLPPDGRRQINSVVSRTRTLNDLLDSVATYARVAKQPLELVHVDMAALVAEVLRELEPEQEGRCVEVRTGELASCTGDLALLRLACYHLLNNALKFTRCREAALIQIGSHSDGRETVWSVADNGVGFRREQVHRLFLPFQRLHRTQGYDGAGVGLATVQRIVSRHDGRVWACLASGGPGAVFSFSLPGS